jgi:hypothetical protein
LILITVEPAGETSSPSTGTVAAGEGISSTFPCS